jgi:hypothetical protein
VHSIRVLSFFSCVYISTRIYWDTIEHITLKVSIITKEKECAVASEKVVVSCEKVVVVCEM